MHDLSRRNLFRCLAGASVLELAHYRAAWARAMAPESTATLFDIERVASGAYFARSRPQAVTNCNAAIFENANDVLIVDAHSKPSAAAALIAQIKREITAKPVRYVVNTHFHWDHTQGDHAYRATGNKIDFIASEPTKKLMSDLAAQRLQASLAAVPQQIKAMESRASKAQSAVEKAWCESRIRQLQAYQAELQNYHLEVPTITFGTSHVIKDKAHDLHIEYHGHAHTGGDVVVFCPQARAVATGDMILGTLPFIADGYPKVWPKTIDSVAKLGFDHVMPGHGPAQHNRQPMTNERNYIEELAEKVGAGKKAGKTAAVLQAEITVESLKSIQSNGYAEYLMGNQDHTEPNIDAAARVRGGVKTNIGDVFKNIDRV
jgi:glyoxylase-like metal-dependent hydrolase (beta-lactamase superfamily II)